MLLPFASNLSPIQWGMSLYLGALRALAATGPIEFNMFSKWVKYPVRRATRPFAVGEFNGSLQHHLLGLENLCVIAGVLPAAG